jgi:fluoroacetyl-CoA thioesterase
MPRLPDWLFLVNCAQVPDHRVFPSGIVRTNTQSSMNHQQVGQIFFEETYTVPFDQTARSLFTRLPHGRLYADAMIECLATGYLVAVVESICIREMQHQVDPAVEVIVGRVINVEHLGPILPGARVRLTGWVERLGERSVTFCVQAYDDHELVCDGRVTLVAADRAALESKIAGKAIGVRKEPCEV